MSEYIGCPKCGETDLLAVSIGFENFSVPIDNPAEPEWGGSGYEMGDVIAVMCSSEKTCGWTSHPLPGSRPVDLQEVIQNLQVEAIRLAIASQFQK